MKHNQDGKILFHLENHRSICSKTKDEIYLKSLFTILGHKEYLLQEIFKMRNIENNIFYPIHIKRIISNVCKKESKQSDISPLEILKENETLKEQLKITDTFENNKMMHILIDIHLHPKILIEKHHIQKTCKSSILDLQLNCIQAQSPNEVKLN